MLDERCPRRVLITSLVVGIAGLPIPGPTHAQSQNFQATRAAAIAASEAEDWTRAAEMWERVAAVNPVNGQN